MGSITMGREVTPADLSTDQRTVFDAMISWADGSFTELAPDGSCKKLLVMAGFAGTGKSTLLGVFAAATDLQVAYVSFTGRASSILASKLAAGGLEFSSKLNPPESLRKRYDAGKQISDKVLKLYDFESEDLPFVGTIHRLLYRPVIDDKEELQGWVKRTTLDRAYDLIVIDEASMVSDELLRDLQSFGVPIMAVGDHGQLPPVMGGSSLMKHPDLRLEKIHRQAEGSPIIQLSREIRETGRLRAPKTDGVNFISRRSAEAAIEAIFKAAREEDRLLSTGALCWTNKMRVKLNAHARRGAGFKGCPNKGEVVICLKNDPPIYNGMRGQLVTAGELDGWRVLASVGFPDDGIDPASYQMCAPQFNRDATFRNLDELRARLPAVGSMKEGGSLFDFGYGLTVHKSQGSQFKHALVFVDREVNPSSEEWRRWIYSAVTRASEHLTVFA